MEERDGINTERYRDRFLTAKEKFAVFMSDSFEIIRHIFFSILMLLVDKNTVVHSC